MNTIFEMDYEGRHYRFVLDDDYRRRRSTRSRAESALGCIVTRPCRGLSYITEPSAHHCECCSNSIEDGSLWGIVLDNRTEAFEKWIREEGKDIEG